MEIHLPSQMLSIQPNIALHTLSMILQYKTMQMMYETIYKALVETGMDTTYEPQDFLNFFCLGKREVSDEISAGNSDTALNGNTPQVYIYLIFSASTLLVYFLRAVYYC